MEDAIFDSDIKKTTNFNHQSFGNHLLANSFGPASGSLYLVPFESAGDFTLRSYRYKYTWTIVVPPVPPGGVGSFNFYVGLYRVMRGTGGTADTLVQASAAPTGSSSQSSAINASGTEYTPQVIASPIADISPEGMYMVGFLWVNTSLIPATVTWAAFGKTLTDFADFFYYAGGGGYTGLPATVASFGAASTFQLYAETT